MTSLRLRLLGWLLPLVGLVIVGAGVGSTWGAASALAGLLDDQLRQVAQNIRAEDGGVTVDRTNALRRHLHDDAADDVLTEVWLGGHRTYTSDPSLRLPPPAATGLHDVVVGTEVWHAFVVRQGERTIRVAQSRDARWEALSRIAVELAWPVAALLPVLGACLWFGIGRGLQPLHRIARELAGRDGASWAPIRLRPMPAEVEPLVDALNDMLARLARAFELQGDFIADASHELRTPIMALSVQVELAENAASADEREAALRQLRSGVARIERLARQLLALARLAPGSRAAPHGAVALGRLSREVLIDQLPAADAKGQALGLETDGDAEVTGDAAMLQMLVRNLVDNAIRYAPPGARIGVAVRREPDGVLLEVQDDGPGIAPEDRPRVFDRFYRGADRGEAGSGLGLAIVKRIADEHGARVDLAGPAGQGAGLVVRVRFPDPAGGRGRPPLTAAPADPSGP